MAKPKDLTVLWSSTSLKHAQIIRFYLVKNFSRKETERFYALLSSFEKTVSRYPELYPASVKKKRIRRAVLNKVLSVFYRIRNNRIEILAVLDNRCNYTTLI